MSMQLLIIQHNQVVTLESAIRSYLQQGWEIYGSPFLITNFPAQAIVNTGAPALTEPAGYKLLMGTAASLQAQCTNQLAMGWQLVGDATIIANQATQAMVSGNVQIYPKIPEGSGEVPDLEPLIAQITGAQSSATAANAGVANANTALAAQQSQITALSGDLLGKAPLVNNKVPYENLPAFPVGRKVTVANATARLALSSHTDLTIAYEQDTADAWGLNPNDDPSIEANWTKLGNAQATGVISFNGRAGNIAPESGDYHTGMITEAAEKRFVSPAQIASWNQGVKAADVDTKIAAQKTADDAVFLTKTAATASYLLKTEKGAANGLVPLGADSLIPAQYIPPAGAVDLSGLIPKTQINAANGVAPLGSDSKVPAINLPTPVSIAGLIPTSQKGAVNGVAPLGADSRVPIGNLPAHLPQTKRIWRDVKELRTVGSWFTNNSNNEMLVHVRAVVSTNANRFVSLQIRENSSGTIFVFNSTVLTPMPSGIGYADSCTISVPVGWQYQLATVGGTTIALTERWYELY